MLKNQELQELLKILQLLILKHCIIFLWSIFSCVSIISLSIYIVALEHRYSFREHTHHFSIIQNKTLFTCNLI